MRSGQEAGSSHLLPPSTEESGSAQYPPVQCQVHMPQVRTVPELPGSTRSQYRSMPCPVDKSLAPKSPCGPGARQGRRSCLGTAGFCILASLTIARGPAHPLHQTALPAAPLGTCTVNWLAGFPREGVGPGWGNPISALGLCTPSPGPAGSPGAVPTVAAAGSGTRCPPDSQGSGCSYGKCGTSVSASVWSRMFPDGRKVQAGPWQGAGHCVSA